MIIFFGKVKYFSGRVGTNMKVVTKVLFLLLPQFWSGYCERKKVKYPQQVW